MFETRDNNGKLEIRIIDNGTEADPDDGWRTLAEWQALLAEVERDHEERADA